MRQSQKHSLATSFHGREGVVREVLATAYVIHIIFVSAVVHTVVDGVFSLARTWWGRQSMLLCLSCRGARGLFSFFPVELKSHSGGRRQLNPGILRKAPSCVVTKCPREEAGDRAQ